MAQPNQLAFWDEAMASSGSYIILQRLLALAALEQKALPIHLQLTSGQEQLQLLYKPSLLEVTSQHQIDMDQLQYEFTRRLAANRTRETEAGMSLLGPHRDDFVFLANGRQLGIYGSRGQQRTTVLALRLAEVELVRERAGEPPILLLDDVMSELDEPRRKRLRETMTRCPQTIVTAIDQSAFDPDLLEAALCLRVVAGSIGQV
jgi:DNA replication and repair protein RecF